MKRDFSKKPVEFYLTMYSLATLVILMILLFLKAGDWSFFAGAAVGISGMIASLISLISSFTGLRATAVDVPPRYHRTVILCRIENFLYLILGLLAAGFLYLLFSAFRHI